MLLSSSFQIYLKFSSLYITFFYCDGWPHDSYLFGCLFLPEYVLKLVSLHQLGLRMVYLTDLRLFYFNFLLLHYIFDFPPPQRMWRLFLYYFFFFFRNTNYRHVGSHVSVFNIYYIIQIIFNFIHFQFTLIFFLEIYAEDNNSM